VGAEGTGNALQQVTIMSENCTYVTLVQEEYFRTKLDELIRRHCRMNEVHTAIDWVLGRDPTVGTPCDESGKHFVFKTSEIGATPSFWVLYRYEEHEGKAYLLSIAPVDRED
jgi:hypothetical protein